MKKTTEAFVLVVGAAGSLAAACMEATAAESGTRSDSVPSEVINEITVTATRQAESISRVPISISAYTQEQMDQQGVKDVADVVRLTPGLSATFSGTGQTRVTIRGVVGSVGAATTGVYIDDMPIQVRNIGTSASTLFPTVFDLERVEVLRGPQGTLFGAGSEGGTVRFIQPQPDLIESSGYARSEIATTKNGDLSYEAGLAGGMPIVEGRLAVRASAFYRRDGGWVDKEYGSLTVNSPTGAAGPGSVSFSKSGLAEEDANWEEVKAARLALTWQITDSVAITPSFTYQDLFRNSNRARGAYMPALSDPNAGEFRTASYKPSIDASHYAIPEWRDNEPLSDSYSLPALAVSVATPVGTLISNSGYFDRDMYENLDYTQIYQTSYAGRRVPVEGDAARSEHWNTQKNFTQELRLQSDDPQARFGWVGGLFYSRNKQFYQQYSTTNFLNVLSPQLGAVDDGPPFGPGYSAFMNRYGAPPLNGNGTYLGTIDSLDEQIAVFGDVNVRITERWKITAGLRYSENTVEYMGVNDGPANNLRAPQGRACVPGTGAGGTTPPCVPVAVGEFAPGEGPFAVAYIVGGESLKENATTPKIGLSFQADANNLFYVTAAKGFRPGGAQVPLPANCNAELVTLGYVDAAGNARSPTSFEADSVWSYEVGSKNRLFKGRLQIDTSVYRINWNNIQSSVAINSCLQVFTDNLSAATSQGFDLQMQLRPTERLNMGLNVGYTDATYDETFQVGPSTLFTKDSQIGGAGAPWTVVAMSNYDFPAFNGVPAFVRADWTFTSRLPRTGATDPGTASYDPLITVQDETRQLNMRAGVTLDSGLDVSLFVNNATNEKPNIGGITRTRNQPVYSSATLRPRTLGVTAAYRF
jgi:iron complex outermembrane receptor protein